MKRNDEVFKHLYPGSKIKGLILVERCFKKLKGKHKYYWKCIFNSKEVTYSELAIMDAITNPKKQFKKYQDKDEPQLNKLLRTYKSHAKNRNIEFLLSKEEFRQLTKQNCHYCGEQPSQYVKGGNKSSKNYIYNGVDRFNNTKGYTKDNCVSSCGKCNFAKFDYTYDEFTVWVKKICDHLKL